MKRQLKAFIIFVTLILVAILIFKVFKMEKFILKRAYPCNYSEYVEKYAEQYNIDPLLIYAIIKAESNFNPNVISSKGARGLMQIMEKTAEEVAKNLEIDYTVVDQLYEPNININIGVGYISFLLKKYDNINLVIVAYNAGIGNVDRWIEEGVIKSDGSDIENVPFKETNSYVRKTLRDYEIYKKLYK